MHAPRGFGWDTIDLVSVATQRDADELRTALTIRYSAGPDATRPRFTCEATGVKRRTVSTFMRRRDDAINADIAQTFVAFADGWLAAKGVQAID